VDSLILWVVIGGIAFAAFAWRMQRAKRKAEADRAAREAIAAATLAAAKAEAQSQVEAQRLEAERKAATKAKKEAARAAANAVIRAEAERVRSQRATRTAEAERSAREAARRAVLEANQEAAAAAKRQPADSSSPAQALAVPPAKPVDPAPSAPTPKPPAAPTAFKSPEQTLILVADDSKVVRLKAGRLLAQHGYRVAYGVDGEDALRQVEAEMPDLVVTDVEMPNLDGFGLARRLKGDARTAHVPIVMITSVDATHRESAMREGVGLVLGKPFPEDQLLAHIGSFRFPLAAPAPVRTVSRPDFAATDAGALA